MGKAVPMSLEVSIPVWQKILLARSFVIGPFYDVLFQTHKDQVFFHLEMFGKGPSGQKKIGARRKS